MHTSISGSAKAVTPFGPLSGLTPVVVEDAGADSVVITFHCGATPVMLAMAGDNYLAFVRACIDRAGAMHHAELADALAECVA
jgi:hypothetical protein